jgi:hypothetical protein
MLGSYLDYSSTPKTEAICLTEAASQLQRSVQHQYGPEVKAFITATAGAQNPAERIQF